VQVVVFLLGPCKVRRRVLSNINSTLLISSTLLNTVVILHRNNTTLLPLPQQQQPLQGFLADRLILFIHTLVTLHLRMVVSLNSTLTMVLQTMRLKIALHRKLPPVTLRVDITPLPVQHRPAFLSHPIIKPLPRLLVPPPLLRLQVTNLLRIVLLSSAISRTNVYTHPKTVPVALLHARSPLLLILLSIRSLLLCLPSAPALVLLLLVLRCNPRPRSVKDQFFECHLRSSCVIRDAATSLM